ncbi:hypothetical protein MVEN_01134200 [Mycena venus]|uniref:Uncharacterized protein n=1 Tax=Mycena venus TaxID=2733690 RepID=A0A8H6Y965_9AGAR|nr:hypothetical protein MVEN_01134200 [Mycena venus]
MSGFPRGCFSEKELNATRWYAKKNGVSIQPTIKQVKNHRKDILNTTGLDTKLLEGNLGNSFAVNDWFKILEHEFANPLVRPKLHLYTEDSGEKLKEARQAAKWKEEVNGNISGPMARGNGGKDYYVEEVCFAKLDNGRGIGPVMPMRWFTRNGNLMSIAHPLRLTPSKSAFIIDGSDNACIEIPNEDYFLNVCDLEDAECQSRYNIPPPSSIAGVEAQTNGIKVWDCEYKDWILIIPWFLAFQGDNSMSSEFASHIGMKGKYFCRVCQAKSDKNNRAPGHAGEIERLLDFMTAGTPRTKEKTITDLAAQLKRALEGAPSAADDMATESGSKDKYFQHFLDKLQAAASKLRDEQKERGPSPSEAGISKAEEVKNLLRQLRSEMPDNIFNPVLSISGEFRNTPVEILHVVLLGVVRYWWRDAVSRQTSKGKEELRARLSSVNVAGLNTPPIRGNTYVQYAGSLVGRDFRVILQVALVVLHGLIPQAHYDGWVALCKLTPLMFQPVIEHLPTYLKMLDDAVFDFLAATALWNTQWFNKPKFHLFVHIPEQIRRFGPLILYATESFESYNLVIRLRSIHSTKHAPSLDIGTAFSHLHAIRHLVSGSYVHRDTNGNFIAPRQAGLEVLALLNDEEFLAFMSMGGLWDVFICQLWVLYRVPEMIQWPENWVSSAFWVRETRCNGVEAYEKLASGASRKFSSSWKLTGLPSSTVALDRHQMVAFKELTTRTRRVLQERQLTDKHEHEVNHAVEPNDCFVNLAWQLRICGSPAFRLSTPLNNHFKIGNEWNGIQKEAEEAKEAERQQKAAERQTKAAEKQAKATQKELVANEKGPNGGKKLKVNSGAHLTKEKGKKPKREEVDRDFAEGEEELVSVTDTLY